MPPKSNKSKSRSKRNQRQENESINEAIKSISESVWQENRVKELLIPCLNDNQQFPLVRQEIEQKMDELPWHKFSEGSVDTLLSYFVDMEETVSYYLTYITNYYKFYYHDRCNEFWPAYPQALKRLCQFIELFLDKMNYEDRLLCSMMLFHYIRYSASEQATTPISDGILQSFIAIEKSLLSNHANPTDALCFFSNSLPQKHSLPQSNVRQLKAWLYYFSQHSELFVRQLDKKQHEDNLRIWIQPCYKLIEAVNDESEYFDTEVAWLIVKFIAQTNLRPHAKYWSRSLLLLTTDNKLRAEQIIPYWHKILKNWSANKNEAKRIDKKFFPLMLILQNRFLAARPTVDELEIELWQYFLSIAASHQHLFSEAEQINLKRYQGLYLNRLKLVAPGELLEQKRSDINYSFRSYLKIAKRLAPSLCSLLKGEEEKTLLSVDWMQEVLHFFLDECRCFLSDEDRDILIDIIVKLIKFNQQYSLPMLTNVLSEMASEKKTEHLFRLVAVGDVSLVQRLIDQYSTLFEQDHDKLGQLICCLYERQLQLEIDTTSFIGQEWAYYKALRDEMDAYLQEIEEELVFSNSRFYSGMKVFLTQFKDNISPSYQKHSDHLVMITRAYEQFKLLNLEAKSKGMTFKQHTDRFLELLNDASATNFEQFMQATQDDLRQFYMKKSKIIYPVEAATAKREIQTATFERLLALNQGLVVKTKEDYFTKIKLLKKLQMPDECIAWCKKFQMVFKAQQNEPFIIRALANAYKQIGRYDITYRYLHKLRKLLSDSLDLTAIDIDIVHCCLGMETLDSLNEAKKICEGFISDSWQTLLTAHQFSVISYITAKGVLNEGNSSHFFLWLEHYLEPRHRLMIEIDKAILQSKPEQAAELAYSYLIDKHDDVILRKFLALDLGNQSELFLQQLNEIEKVYEARYNAVPDINLLKALIHIEIRSSNFEKAMDHLKTLENLYGKSMWIIALLSKVYLKLRLYECVIVLLQQVDNIHLNKYLYFQLAKAYAAIPEQRQKALECLDYLIETHPTNKMFYDKGSELATQCNDTERLIKYHSEFRGVQYEDERILHRASEVFNEEPIQDYWEKFSYEPKEDACLKGLR
ncbi:MAG: hypothetical protein CK426_02015 [Legionella sp.]|nr:MAG: hypothetical protein CK423_00345 [Legionella sp.]PJD99581.1 MAG: hypothetical protein CK426_02015 [Legionella sp.]